MAASRSLSIGLNRRMALPRWDTAFFSLDSELGHGLARGRHPEDGVVSKPVVAPRRVDDPPLQGPRCLDQGPLWVGQAQVTDEPGRPLVWRHVA